MAKVDRLARQTEDHFSVRQILTKHGVALHSVTEPIGNSPTEKFVETVLAAGAEFDNAVRRQRCTDGMIGRIRQGIYPWKPPLGYRCAQHRKHDEKKTIPDRPEREVFDMIQRALQGYLEGSLRTLSDVATALDEWGLEQRRGRATSPQLVDRILGSYLDYYSGQLRNPWDGSLYQGGHEPMISSDDCQRIRLIRAGRLKRWTQTKTRDNPEFPLRRLLRCADCGRNLTGAMSRGGSDRIYPYYTCANRACGLRGKSIARDRVHAQVDALIANVSPRKDAWAMFERFLRRALASDDANRRGEADAAERRVTLLEEKRRTLFDLREDGTYSKEVFLERLASVNLELAEARLNIPTAETRQLSVTEALAAAREFYLNLQLQWKTLTPTGRRRFEQDVFPSGIVVDQKHGVRTPELGPILSLVRVIRDRALHGVNLSVSSSNAIVDELSRF